MDAFYASVEQRDNPDLRGKPLVVGGSTNRGVVAAASYEAREFGIRSAMPMRDAYRRCASLMRVRPRMSHYQKVSRQIFGIFRSFTPLVEGLSLDEAFLDVTASAALFGSPIDIATAIKSQIEAQTKLTASVGVAENKLVAKIASDLEKPDGLTVVYPEHYETRLDPLPVSVIPGIGRETLKRLFGTGIRTVRDLRLADDSVLEPVFGRFTRKARDRASGFDERRVVPARTEKSISAEEHSPAQGGSCGGHRPDQDSPVGFQYLYTTTTSQAAGQWHRPDLCGGSRAARRLAEPQSRGKNKASRGRWYRSRSCRAAGSVCVGGDRDGD
jgi:DNA polymerase-4